MEDEVIDIMSETGEPTGKACLKSEIHKKGYYHNTVNIWFYTYEGQVLLQQRAASKSICPLLWDVSVSGHVDSGEPLLTAAIREIQEEIGLEIKEHQLTKIGVFKSFQSYPSGIVDNEFHHTYIAPLIIPLNKLTPQPEEVEDLKLVTISEFYDKLEGGDDNGYFISSNKKHYEFVIQSILQAIE